MRRAGGLGARTPWCIKSRLIKNQLASMNLTLGPYVVQIWSRNPQNGSSSRLDLMQVRHEEESAAGAARRARDETQEVTLNPDTRYPRETRHPIPSRASDFTNPKPLRLYKPQPQAAARVEREQERAEA